MRIAAITMLAVIAGCSQNAGEETAQSSTGDTAESASMESKVAGACDALSMENAMEARTGLQNMGLIGAWTVYGDDKLACSEPDADANVECELQDSGVAVLDYAPEIVGFENRSGELVVASIDADGVTCAPVE